MITLTEANFDEEILASDVAVIVDDWVPWCGPCRLPGPVIEQIAEERSETVTVGRVHVDEQPVLADRAGVSGIPFVMLYRDGQPAAQTIGAQPKNKLERALGLGAAVATTAASSGQTNRRPG